MIPKTTKKPKSMLSLTPAVATAVALATLGACSSLAPPTAPAPAPAPARPSAAAQPVVNCPALAAQALPGTRITEALFVAAGTQRAREPSGREVGEPLPEHCIVRGRIDERTGQDGKPYHTGFELRLPSAWNGRFVYQGGGGNDGIVFNAVGRNTGALSWADNGLSRGFAAVSTDAGHQSPAPLFGLDPQARIEHAYRAHDRTAVTAKALVAAYYGRGADRSYFVGCSGGGRQGMMFSQRFPSYFDGIVAVAPAMRVAEGATISAAWTTQRFLAIAPAGADGKPVLARAFSDADLKLVADAVLQRCDAADGLADGLVHHTAACKIDVAALQCAGDKTATCLSAPQVKALNEVMAGPRNAAGRALYTGWPWDPGIAGADWRNWTLGTAADGAPPNSRHVTLMSGALGHEFVTPPDPSLTVLNFDFERDPARMQAFHREYDTADDVQLKGYRQRGGKLLFFHGMADPIFSASEMQDYQQRLSAVHGADTPSFARLFLVPGMNHCSSGPATDAFDGLGAVVDWVEKGEAPQRIVARGTAALPGIARPLCPWPQYARYRGTGDVKDAASFECVK